MLYCFIFQRSLVKRFTGIADTAIKYFKIQVSGHQTVNSSTVYAYSLVCAWEYVSFQTIIQQCNSVKLLFGNFLLT